MSEDEPRAIEGELLEIRRVDTLMERFKTTPLPLTRRIALLARIDETAARAYAAKLEADEAVIEKAMSLMRTIGKAQNIEKLLAKDRAELDAELEEARYNAGLQGKIRRKKGEQELGRLDEEHKTDLLREKVEQSRLQRQIDEPESRQRASKQKPSARERAEQAFSEVFTTRAAVLSAHQQATQRVQDDQDIPETEKPLLLAELDAKRDQLLERLRR